MNTFWNNGTGLPETQTTETKIASSKLLVGDGGAGWRAKALKRAAERTSESVGEMESPLKNSPSGVTHTRERERSQKRSQFGEREYLKDSPQMKVPSVASGKWRRQEKRGEEQSDIITTTTISNDISNSSESIEPHDANEIAAEMLRAQLSGDQDTFLSLKAKLDLLQSQKSKKKQPEIITGLDDRGRPSSLNISSTKGDTLSNMVAMERVSHDVKSSADWELMKMMGKKGWEVSDLDLCKKKFKKCNIM